MKELLQSFGACLRFLLHQKGIHAEQLVNSMNETGMVKTNKPAVSRIMTGKRMPKINEARVMADRLECPLLFEAYTLLVHYKESKDQAILLSFYETIDQIQSGEHHSQDRLPAIHYNVLYQMVKNLYEHCLRVDVSKQIQDEFITKLAHVSGFGEMIKRMRAMYQCFFHASNLSIKDRSWLAAALLYFLNPIDLIPDSLVPYGYMDDAMVIGFVFFKLRSLLSPFMGQFEQIPQPTDTNTKPLPVQK